jgi:hypothetical protein
MRLKAKTICAAIKKYQEGDIGTAWEIFWDYKRGIEKDGGDIFDDKNLTPTTMQLFIYLCCFGMTRNSNALTKSDLNTFTKVIRNSRRYLKAISPIKFEELKEDSRKVVEAAYNCLDYELERMGISNTDTMITKILMASWGHTPAYDSYFKKTYRKYLKPLPGDYFKSLLKLKDEYKTNWKSRFDCLEAKYAKTKGGNSIPHARLIDMAFWQI